MVKLKQNSRTVNSLLNTISSFGGELLLIILRFITRTVFIYVLGKEYLGINGLFSDILSMLSLTELGLDTAINYKLYKPLADNDEKRVRVLLKFYKQAYRVIGIAIFGIGVCIIPLLPYLIQDYDSLEALHINAVLVFILYLAQSASSYLFFAYRSAVMKANQKRYVLDIVNYVVNILCNIAQIIILLVSKDFILYTASALVSIIARNMIDAIIVKRYYPGFFIKEDDNLSQKEVFGLFKDCGALFLYKVNGSVLKATDNIVLSKFLGLAVVGLYSNYLLLYTTCKSLLNRVYEALKASMGNLFATSSIETKYHFFEVMNLLTFILYGTAGVGVAVCANELIHVWVSSEYVIALPFPILIGCEILFTGISNNLGQIRNVSGVFRQSWYRPVLSAIVNLAVSILLVNKLGVHGVIIGTLVSILTTNFVFEPYVIYKYSFNSYKHASEYYIKNFLYFVILSLVCAFDYFICGIVLPGHGWLSLILHACICGLSVPLIFLLCFGRTKEGKYLIELFKSIGKRIRAFAGKRTKK